MNRQSNPAVQSVLVCNAGSSSLKLAGCEVRHNNFDLRWQISSEGNADELCNNLRTELSRRECPQAVLHRIVHAGLVQEEPQRLDDALLARISHWAALAPLHNHLALRLIDTISQQCPQVSQFAVFDSGLYARLPAVASRYALPGDLSPLWPLRRYGFHGLAHRSQWRSVQQSNAVVGQPMPRRLITLQLGSGCSVTTWRDNQTIDTTMGFTPLEGVVMATRSGSIDPGILLHLLGNEGMTVAELSALLTKESGLAALADGGGDMRRILALATAESEAAVHHFCMQIRKAVGAAIAVLGGVDAISIGGGIGEHQPQVRAGILDGLEELGIALDSTRNFAAQGLTALHHDDSRAQIWLTPVNEVTEMICQYQKSMQVQENK